MNGLATRKLLSREYQGEQLLNPQWDYVSASNTTDGGVIARYKKFVADWDAAIKEDIERGTRNS